MLHLHTRAVDLRRAQSILKRGGVVVIPTDTAYGLAVDPRNRGALKRIFQIKQRPPEKALPWVAGSLAQVQKYFFLSSLELRLAKKFWPGPLSLVLRHKRTGVKVAIRVPAVTSIRSLCITFGRPLTATSANISGKPNCYSPISVRRQFQSLTLQPDALIDAGRLHRRRPSTIVELRAGRPHIYRTGPITEKNILQYV